MANNLVKVITAGAQLIARAFVNTVRKEYNASIRAAVTRADTSKKETGSSSSWLGISLDEAKQILNVTDLTNTDHLSTNYEHLMKVNNKAEGGSFYIQSKIYRAKERIDAELKELNKADDKASA